MQLVSEHLQRSKSVRDRLRLLAFNSIIEASHLGTQADAILAISTSIKGISAAWGQITEQSGHAMQEILNLVKQTNQVMEAFSEASNERLREAQVQTRAALGNLRTAAEFAASQAQQMKAATEKMQAQIAGVGKTGDLLDACFGRGDAVLAEIECLRRQLEVDHPDVKERYDAAEVEQLFSASYTTEMERDVLHAALRGTALPVGQPTFAGNSVELF
jgi:Spy/CpxP family protein refolding chaperone